MVKSMIEDLKNLELVEKSSNDILIDCLLQRSKCRTYVPVLKRQKCGKLILGIVRYIYINNKHFREFGGAN